MIAVPDASVLVTALSDKSDAGESVRSRLADDDLIAPAIVDLEVAAVIRRGLLNGRMSEHHAAIAIAELIDLPMERVPHTGLLPRIWELSANVTAYDAAYVALAEILSVPLLTSDSRLANAPGPRCQFELLK